MDQRRADIAQELGLQDAKSVTTPNTREDTDRVLADPGTPLPPKEGTQYRAFAARLHYLAVDRADFQFAAQEVAKHMATPHTAHWNLLKRVGRYLKGAPKLVQLFAWQSAERNLHLRRQ